MNAVNEPAPALRDRTRAGNSRVGYLELFFDLIFVFAVTQLSHRLLADISPGHALETAFLFVAVWWVWIFTTWAMNWLNPDNIRVRMVVFGLCFVGLIMSVSIPGAFNDRGLPFALSYSGAQIGRTAFMCATFPAGSRLSLNFRRIAVWFLVSSIFWIGGAFVEGSARAVMWIFALGIDLLGPLARYYTPRLGSASVADWSISGEHMAERCALFIIIALGESLLITGATVEKLTSTAPVWLAFIAAIFSTFAMWWVYFDTGIERGAHFIAHHAEPGRVGRRVYTYFHAVIVFGIIVSAVGDELALAHPVGHLEWPTISTVAGGSLIYLLGCGLFKREIAGNFPLSHMIGVGLCLIGVAAARFAHVEPHQFALWCMAAMIVTAIWERWSLSSGLPEAKRANDANA